MSWNSQNFTGSRMIWINVEKLPWLVGKKKKKRFRENTLKNRAYGLQVKSVSVAPYLRGRHLRSCDMKIRDWCKVCFSQEYGIFWIYGFHAQNPSVITFSYVSYSIRNKATGSLVTAGVNSGYLSGAILLDLLNYPRNFSAQWQFQSC